MSSYDVYEAGRAIERGLGVLANAIKYLADTLARKGKDDNTDS